MRRAAPRRSVAGHAFLELLETIDVIFFVTGLTYGGLCAVRLWQIDRVDDVKFKAMQADVWRVARGARLSTKGYARLRADAEFGRFYLLWRRFSATPLATYHNQKEVALGSSANFSLAIYLHKHSVRAGAVAHRAASVGAELWWGGVLCRGL